MNDENPGERTMRADGERIALLRGRLGWDQGTLAEEAGVSRDTVSKLENGMRRRPRTVTIMKLSRALGVDLAALARAPRGGTGGPGAADEQGAAARSNADGGRGREVPVPLANLEPTEAKRVALRHTCEALNGPDLTILLQVAARMLYVELAVASVTQERGGDRTNGHAGIPSPTGETPR